MVSPKGRFYSDLIRGPWRSQKLNITATSHPLSNFSGMVSHVPSTYSFAMELDDSSDDEMSRISASSPSETGSHPPGTTDLFATDFLRCATCCSLCRDGLKEKTAGKLETRRYSLPFSELESRSSGCRICSVLCEIVKTFVPLEDRVDIKVVVDPGIADFTVLLIR